MKILTIIFAIGVGLWLPVAFMDAMALQSTIDAVAHAARVARTP